MDITPLLSYLCSTSNVAQSCREFAWRVKSNGFPIQTSKGGLCLENLAFYKSLEFSKLDEWMRKEVFSTIDDSNIDELKLLFQHQADVEAKNMWGYTALIYASYNGKTDCLRLLLQEGADIKAKDNVGKTALHWAAWADQPECLKILLEHGAKVDPYLRQEYPQYAELWRASDNCRIL